MINIEASCQFVLSTWCIFCESNEIMPRSFEKAINIDTFLAFLHTKYLSLSLMRLGCGIAWHTPNEIATVISSVG